MLIDFHTHIFPEEIAERSIAALEAGIRREQGADYRKGEALTGRLIGARDGAMLRLSVRYVFAWSMAIALLFMGLYASTSVPVLRLLTSDETVVQAARQFLPWLLLMPPLGCAAFTWDGIFLGATASRGLMVSMAGAAAAFFGLWFAGRALLHPTGATALHLLFAASFAHLAFRTLWLTLRYRREVLGRDQM